MKREIIADLPADERPRERMFLHGAATLSDAELVAILLGTGTRGTNALQLARELLADGLTAFARQEWPGGRRSSGIGAAKASRIAAALELGRRVAAGPKAGNGDPLKDRDLLARRLMARYSHHLQERLGALYLDAKHRLLREREIYVGTLNSAAVSTRDVLRHALDDHAAAIIIFHNHPSGDPTPSAEDLHFTRRMREVSDAMGIDLLDHLILGANRWVSLKERGVL